MTSTHGRQHQALDAHNAVCDGDLSALRAALRDPPGFPNCPNLPELSGGWVVQYAIYWSPLSFIAELIALGADPNFEAGDGFPALLAALSSERADKHDLIDLLHTRGADLDRRGHNDWTPLHWAVAQRDLASLEQLLRLGADPTISTRIDDYTTPLEDAEATGFAEAVELLQRATEGRE